MPIRIPLFSLEVGAGLILALSIVHAVGAPPPRRHRPPVVLLAGFAGVGLLPVGTLAAAAGHRLLALVLIAGAVEMLCLAVWAARRHDDGGDDDGGGGPGGGEGDGPIDWDQFDRLRDAWGRVGRTG